MDLFGADLAPAAVILVMLLLNLMKGELLGLLRERDMAGWQSLHVRWWHVYHGCRNMTDSVGLSCSFHGTVYLPMMAVVPLAQGPL